MSRAPMLRSTALLCLALCACGGSGDPGFQAKSPAKKSKKGPALNIDDRSRCEWRGRNDREASEVAGPGSLTPNVRRVYQVMGVGDDRRKVLVCREIDTNFDGIKDVFRSYNAAGESLYEEADTDHDGRIDTWLTFAKGRLAETRVDTNRDGNIDEWKFYSQGKLSRVRRDRNRDGKPDIWEIYNEGRLERMGVDLDGDERVDRWDHDNELRRRLEEEERKKEEEAAAAAAKKAADAHAQSEKEAEKDAEAESVGEKKDEAKANAKKEESPKKEAPPKAPKKSGNAQPQ